LRLGVQCERSVRDPTRLAALEWTNQVGWPSGLGIETRPHRALPSGVSANRWQVEEERRQ